VEVLKGAAPGSRGSQVTVAGSGVELVWVRWRTGGPLAIESSFRWRFFLNQVCSYMLVQSEFLSPIQKVNAYELDRLLLQSHFNHVTLKQFPSFKVLII
jgi:hypothetical protein